MGFQIKVNLSRNAIWGSEGENLFLPLKWEITGIHYLPKQHTEYKSKQNVREQGMLDPTKKAPREHHTEQVNPRTATPVSNIAALLSSTLFPGLTHQVLFREEKRY